MKKHTLLTLGLCWSALSLISCEPNEPETQPYDQGVLVVNAGNFLDNNGTVSFISPTGTVSTDIFNRVNQRSLTGGLREYTEADGKGLLLVDNSTAGQDKLELVDARTFRSVASLGTPDIENPRSAVRVSANKVYVSCWDATGDFANFFKNPGYIAVLDLATNKVSRKIPAMKGAGRMLLAGNEIWLGNEADQSSLFILDPATDQVKTQLTLGASPEPIGLDANGKIWVYAAGEMYRIQPASRQIEARLKVGTHREKTPSLVRMSADKRSIYFLYSFYDAADNFRQKGEVYRFSINDTSIPATQPFFNRIISGLEIDPRSGQLYAGITPSFKQAGYVLRLGTNGTVIDSVRAEIAPSAFYFK